MYTVTMTVHERARELLERVHWPDGLICPWCGARERVVPVIEDGVARLRYECASCGAHSGFLRTNLEDRYHPTSA